MDLSKFANHMIHTLSNELVWLNLLQIQWIAAIWRLIRSFCNHHDGIRCGFYFLVAPILGEFADVFTKMGTPGNCYSDTSENHQHETLYG